MAARKALVATGVLVLLTAAGPWTGLDLAPAARADVATIVDARLPVGRGDASAVWTGQHAFVFGGHEIAGGEAGTTSDQILRYDPGTDTLEIMGAKLPAGRRSMAAVWTGQHAFLFGGVKDETTANIDQVLRYDPAADRLEVMQARLPSGRSDVGAVWTGEHVFLFGGWKFPDLRRFDDILRYDPATDTLATMAAKLPSAREDMSAVWTGQHALLFGGDVGTSTDQVVRYDPATDAVTTLGARLPFARIGTAAVWDGSFAYVLGGWDHGVSKAFDQIVRYDPAADAMQVMGAKLPSPREDAAEVWTGSDAFLFGGRDHANQVRFDEIVRYNPLLPDHPHKLLAASGPGLGQVTLTWEPPGHAAQDGITGYRIYRGTASVPEALLAEVGADVTSFTDGGLDPATTYHYKLSSVNPAGEGLRSPKSCAAPTPGQFLPSTTPPCPLPEGWRERPLAAQSLAARAPLAPGPVVLDGAPRASDPRYYEVSLSVGGRALPVVSVFTGGFVQQPVHAEVPGSPSPATEGAVSVAYRYDPSQPVCLVQVGASVLGVRACAPSPVDPLQASWLAGVGPKAEVIVKAQFTGPSGLSGAVLRVPLAGQAGALLP